MSRGEKWKPGMVLLLPVLLGGLVLGLLWHSEIKRLNAAMTATSIAISRMRVPADRDGFAAVYHVMERPDAALAGESADPAVSLFELGTMLRETCIQLGFQLLRHQIKTEDGSIDLQLQTRDRKVVADFCDLIVHHELPAKLRRLHVRQLTDGKLLVDMEAELWP